ncbi:unnamed protein product [Diatraea saccharalis]|uniref:BBS2 platform domain-containing protein n=1 Tax=Diatraea saccharalis TaxID=40085 RepID=A0A9N9WJQ4_9NEOP|nr:unnamed protein product [Diatraea saccharalis]
MYTIAPQNVIVSKDSYVTFRITERVQRICIWINQNFLLDQELELTSEETKELQLTLYSLRDQSLLNMNFGSDGNVKFYTSDIRLAGDLVQSLAIYLNLIDLQVTSYDLKNTTLFIKKL